MGTVLRLKDAHIQQRASYQYLLGLKCLIFWELKQLYAYYSAGCVVRVQRNTLRHRYFADPESRVLFPMGIRIQMWEEYQGMAQNGTDPEDHYADTLEGEDDDDDEDYDTDIVNDVEEVGVDEQNLSEVDNNRMATAVQQQHHLEASASSDYEEEQIVFPERLHCFVAWDLFNRGN